jgi:hypothetical protein
LKNAHHSRHADSSISYQRDGGFSLFEFVVFIIVVAIVYAVAANRFSAFPGAAERANFLAVTTQLKSSINLELMRGVSSGRQQSLKNFEASNPMELLLEAPSNYIGAFDLVDKSRLAKRIWYFDRSSNELVYLISDSENTFRVQNELKIPTDELRFKLELVYRYEDSSTGLTLDFEGDSDAGLVQDNIEKRLSGLLLTPVFPYEWGGPSLSLPDATISDASS